MSSPYCGERQSWDIKTATETCAIDCNFINRFNGSKSEAVQSLVVGEVFRRMNQVQKVFGTKTKLMIFADMWDPMYFYQTVITWKNDTVRTAPGILSLPGLPDDSARARFRRNVILMPWTFQESPVPTRPAITMRRRPFRPLRRTALISSIHRRFGPRQGPAGGRRCRHDAELARRCTALPAELPGLCCGIMDIQVYPSALSGLQYHRVVVQGKCRRSPGR